MTNIGCHFDDNDLVLEKTAGEILELIDQGYLPFVIIDNGDYKKSAVFLAYKKATEGNVHTFIFGNASDPFICEGLDWLPSTNGGISPK